MVDIKLKEQLDKYVEEYETPDFIPSDPVQFVHRFKNKEDIEIAKKVCDNPEYPAPTLWINPDKTDFYSFTVDDFKLIDYQATKLDEKIEVAI